MDIDYTDEVTAITTQFYGFNSQACGGISQYEWAVGVANREGGVVKESVMAFTSIGVVTLSTPGSGYAQRPLPNLSSLSGQRLFITVRGTTDCGDTLESTSDGFVIVTSPPTLRILGTVSDTTEHAQFSGQNVYQSASRFSARWDISEEDSDINEQVSIKFGSYPGGDDIDEEVEVSENYFHGDIASDDGTPIFVTVTAVNEAGLETVAVSNVVVRDTSPPVIEVVCALLHACTHTHTHTHTGICMHTHTHAHPHTHAHTQVSSYVQYFPSPVHRLLVDPSLPTTGVLNIDFLKLLDPQSGITNITISAGASPNDQSVLSSTVVSLGEDSNSIQTSVVLFNLSESLFARFEITNGAGLVTVESVRVRTFKRPAELDAELNVYSNSNSSSRFAKCLCDTDVVTVYADFFSDNTACTR